MPKEPTHPFILREALPSALDGYGTPKLRLSSDILSMTMGDLLATSARNRQGRSWKSATPAAWRSESEDSRCYEFTNFATIAT